MNCEHVVLDLLRILLCVYHFISWKEFQHLWNWRLGRPQESVWTF